MDRDTPVQKRPAHIQRETAGFSQALSLVPRVNAIHQLRLTHAFVFLPVIYLEFEFLQKKREERLQRRKIRFLFERSRLRALDPPELSQVLLYPFERSTVPLPRK